LQKFKRVIFFLVDGVRADHLEQALQEGVLPALSQHILERGIGRRATTSFPSVTGPSFVPFLTGVSCGAANLPGIRWFDRSQTSSNTQALRDYYGLGAYFMGKDIAPEAKTLFEKIPGSTNIMCPMNRGTNLRRDTAFLKAPFLFLKSKRKNGLVAVEEEGRRCFLKAMKQD